MPAVMLVKCITIALAIGTAIASVNMVLALSCPDPADNFCVVMPTAGSSCSTRIGNSQQVLEPADIPDIQFDFENKCSYDVYGLVSVPLYPKDGDGLIENVVVKALDPLKGTVNASNLADRTTQWKVPFAPLARSGGMTFYPSRPSGQFADTFDSSKILSLEQQQRLFGMTADGSDTLSAFKQYAMVNAMGSPISMSEFGQRVEFTIVGRLNETFTEYTLNPQASTFLNEPCGYREYDIDLTNVDIFALPVQVRAEFSTTRKPQYIGIGDTTAIQPGIDLTCIQVSSSDGLKNVQGPSKSGCDWASEAWLDYAAPDSSIPLPSSAPTGICRGPNKLCGNIDGTVTLPSECSAHDDVLGPILDLMKKYYTITPNYPSVVSATQIFYLCLADTFNRKTSANAIPFNNMCSAVNRGQCDLSTFDDTFTQVEFESWIESSCGTKQQNNAPPSDWFKAGYLSNPYVKYVRAPSEMASTAYSFSQDEGLHGGNANCKQDPANGVSTPQAVTSAPTSVSITFCP